MGSSLFKSVFPFIVFFFVLAISEGKPHGFSRVLKKEKLSHFRLYWHDIVGGSNPSAVQVAAAPTTNTSATLFGTVMVIDDALTEGPELSSKLVGRAQGFYTLSSQSEVGLLMSMNFAFMEGKYNGSTITILGRNAVFTKVREMPVIGGSGLFRFARGYVQARTHTFNLKTGDATSLQNTKPHQ
uniref:Dirigent protein n=1 Tax=Nelumbo nucifera TaxID=4432 RepID=A0A822YCL4_NELNU|nr:TPA_asm: hypothetical protein HUJ06_031540 [Nelumbo nucifera]